ncbi:ATP-binding cassette domain-containing protein [Compostimonas suwonensis]|uniref:ABC-2 type transport system ATP-binding protein n=1 Tax=Compostimonas suwonensis TaxID=1048394 RepID=A0A2M9BU76_9MICO|nr:ATP-binding cassette domain-containing protein [Compostimonas suwonensis]PJJ61480.1 ABC-2 type transport system ATP-binding protein [Compostimonas suwonensis]
MTTHTDTIISARRLSKRFIVKKAPVDAVVGLDLEVERGELVAFLGPNGAGKSTSLRMLTTLIPPTSGQARVAGHDIRRDPAEVRRRIGYIGQGNSASQYQRVRDELLSQGAFYGLGRGATRRRADELIESLDLGSFAKRPVQGLSGGQKRRVDIALGLIHGPELLFLDEPSTGLDPQSRANLWEHILRLREEYGTTIFLTTHYLDEADQLAERVMVMDEGRMIADDTAAGLKRTLAGDRIVLTLDDAADAADAVACARAAGASRAVAEGRTVTCTVDEADAALLGLLRELDGRGIRVSRATLHQPTLDDVFLALTGRSLRESGAAAEHAIGQTTEPAKAEAAR